MAKVESPFLIVNPKSYLYGEKSLELAKAADKTAKETGLQIYFTCPYADIRLIKENTENMTVFLVSQRVSTIRNADHILVLDDGKIAGIGTHLQLLKENQVYKEICESQMAGEEA